MQVEKFYITVNSQKLYYTKIGNGKKPIIVLLGWLSNLDRFPYKNSIGNSGFDLQKYSFYFVHLSGLYKSDIPKYPYTVDEYVKELRKFILKKKLIKPILIGHSAGGRYVIKYASKYPEKVDKIVLMAAAGAKPLKAKQTQLKRVQYYFHKFSPFLTQNEKNILSKTFENLYNSNLQADMQNIKAKTLVIWGKKDDTIRFSRAKIYKKYIKNVEIGLFKNYGHMITYQPSVFNRVNKFINEN